MDPPGSSGVLPHRIPGTSRGGDLARPSPPKPWERNSSSSLSRPSAIGSPSTALTTSSLTPTNTTTTTTTTPRPPLRPWERRTEYGRDYDTGYGYGRDPYYNNRDRIGYGSSYGNYGSRDSYGGYGGYGGNGGYGSNGGYGNYGGYGNSGYGGYGNSGYSGYGGYGYRDPYDKSGFHQVLANGNSFFSNLQYFVDSFGRFSRLLDANYDAMHGSFASVVRLLEHMGRLNSEVMTVIKTFTLFRIMQSLVTRCFGVFRYILGRRGGDSRLVGGVEGAGNTSSLLDVNDFRDFARGGVKMIPSPGQHGANPQAPPSWRGLLLVFVVTFVGLPMVVNKLFTLLARRNELELEWSKEGRGEQVVALHDFEGESQRELSFRKGDTLYIINKFHPDWWEASCDGRVGIIPANYVSAATEAEPESLHDEFKSAAK